MAKLAFLGLGVMGYPMAGHLKKGGHEVTVYNRTSTKAEAWVKEHGGKMAATPAGAAHDADIVFCCVGADQDLYAVTTGTDGAFSGMKAGSIFVDNTTASADAARTLDGAARELGLHMIDAPVSGGQAGAENGKLTVMCGGEADIFDKAMPIISCYAAKVILIGASGAGQLTKMVNQICIAGLVQGLSEAINFGQRADLDMDKVLDVISGGAAQSWQMVNRGSTMAADEFEFGFALDWMIKDLGMCMSEAKKNGSSLPVTALVAQYYAQLSDRGFGRNDTSALIKLLR
ncbi:MAG: NAD(P)-dependent oxidoreductase [Alphaproteobacteria bacterium]|nr:NAD(P)-dependent oxidoreductase [Alphaproteobacteria bacterium]